MYQQQQSIQKRNEIIEEYIKSLDNKPSTSSNTNQDDDDDPFAIAVTNLAQQKKIYQKKPFSQSKPKRFSIDSKKPPSHTPNILKERELSQGKSGQKEKIKKRNKTARNQTNKLNLYSNLSVYNDNTNNKFFSRVKSTNKNRQIENMHKFYFQMMNNPSNPYSTNWTNKLLNKQYNMKLGVNGFINGVPVITLNKKKDKFPEITKKELKQKLNTMNMREIDENIPKEMFDQFNTNKKNFFKIRKDIQEESFENEEDSNEECNDNNKEIKFPLIYQYFNTNIDNNDTIYNTNNCCKK